MAPGIIGLQLKTKYVPLNRNFGNWQIHLNDGETGLQRQCDEGKDKKRKDHNINSGPITLANVFEDHTGE